MNPRIEKVRSVVRWIPAIEDVTYMFELADTMSASDDAIERGWGKLARGYVHNTLGEHDKAFAAFKESESEFESVDDKEGLSNVFKHVGYSQYTMGTHQAAIASYTQSLELCIEIGDDIGEAWMHMCIGNAAMFDGFYEIGLESFTKAQGIFERVGSLKDIPICNMNIGNIYASVSDYVTATSYYQMAFDGAFSIRHTVTAASALNNMSSMFSSMHQYKEALEINKRALDISLTAGDLAEVPYVLAAMGQTEIELGDHEQGLAHVHEALTRSEELNDRNLVAAMNLNYSMALSHVKQYDEAEKYLKLYEQQNVAWRGQIFKSLQVKADILQARGQRDEAIALLHEALEHARDMKSPRSEEVVHDQLRDIYKAAGDFEGYLRHNDAFQKIADEIRNTDVIKRIALRQKEEEIEVERQQRDKERAVLHSTLPPDIAERVIRGETVNDHIDNAAVMFVDIVGFTTLSSTLTSQEVTTLLDAVFGICDEACSRNSVTRIKTIGDSYLAVAMPNAEVQMPISVVAIANVAQQIIDRVKATDFSSLLVASPEVTPNGVASREVAVRIGLHCGPITAGVLGKERLQYDVWGDTVNVASRMESSGEPNRIHVSEQFAQALTPLRKGEGPGESSRENEGSDLASGNWHLEFRGATEVKGKGTMQTFWLERT